MSPSVTGRLTKGIQAICRRAGCSRYRPIGTTANTIKAVQQASRIDDVVRRRFNGLRAVYTETGWTHLRHAAAGQSARVHLREGVASANSVITRNLCAF